jgi:hypothetical protein
MSVRREVIRVRVGWRGERSGLWMLVLVCTCVSV